MGPLWIDACYDSSCAHEELMRRGMSISNTEGKRPDLCVEKKDNCKDLRATSLSFVASLKACAKNKDLWQGTKIHADIRNSGLLEKSTYIYLGNMLASMYAKCGEVSKAAQVLDDLPVRNVVSWNTLIAAYSQHELGQEALDCYERMLTEGLSPNAITYTCILKACAITLDVNRGKQIHDEIFNKGLLGMNVVLGNALVDMYAKCGAVAKAKLVLDELPAQDVVSWNALIAGYAQQELGEDALNCYEQMRSKKVTPNAITYTCILKACGITQDAERGKQIHDEISTRGLLVADVVLGNSLIDMYAKCGAVFKAQEVLDNLPIRNVVSWNALIAGYVQQGLGKEAQECYERIQSEGLFPNAITYTCVVRACGITRDLNRGKQIHDEIVSKRLLRIDPGLVNALADMYAKCGATSKALQVLDELPVRDVFTWSTVIAGFAQQGLGKEAFDCFERMQSEGVVPNAAAYIGILKACGITRDTHKGKQIHDEVVSRGLLGIDAGLGNALIDMYAKCGAVARAKEVLDELPAHNVVSWNALIAGCVEQGLGKKALDYYDCMQSEGFSPDAITYTCVLKACSITRDVERGKKIDDEIVTQGLLGRDIMLGNSLVDMYVKCGAAARAQQVLEGLPIRDVVSWNALIAGYSQQGLGKQALDCYEQMQSEGLSPDAITYTCILRACGITRNVEKGKQIYNEIVSKGLSGIDVLGNALVDMYAKCGALAKAQQVLDEMPLRDVGSWNALIAGYTQQEKGKEALECFQRMQSEGVPPNALTYTCNLKACGIIQDVDRGKKIHDEIAHQGLLLRDAALGNALVDMYAKCGANAKAHQVLDELPVRDVVSWSSLIAGYARQSQDKEVLRCYEQMQSEGLSPNAITYNCILKAFGTMQDAEIGKIICDEIFAQGLVERNFVLGNALVNMYAKCGAVVKAQEVLNNLPVRDVVSWSALIAGFVQHGLGKEGLDSYERMQSEGLSPDAITYTYVLKSCGITWDVDRGEKIHDEIVSKGLLERNAVLGNALVAMYADCGAFLKAQQVLDKLPFRDVVCWTALIAGYAQHGHCKEAMGCFQRMRSEGIIPNTVSWNALIGGYAQQGLAFEALECFQWMQREGTSPDAVTFVCVLKACSRAHLVNDGEMYFKQMREDYGITPDKKHHTCMVDLFGHAGHFDKAMAVMKQMPSFDHFPVWSALLGASQKWGNVKHGRFAFEHAVRVGERDAGPYLLMADIYAAVGMQEDAEKIEPMSLQMLPVCS